MQKCEEMALDKYSSQIEGIGFGRDGLVPLRDMQEKLDRMQSVKDSMEKVKPKIREYHALKRKLEEVERKMTNPRYDYIAKWDSVYGSFQRLQAIKSELDSITKDANEYIEKLRAKYKELSGQEFVSEAEAEAWSSLHSLDTSQADKKVKEDEARPQEKAKAEEASKAKTSLRKGKVQKPEGKQDRKEDKSLATDIDKDRMTEIKDPTPDSGAVSVKGKD